jgi:plasmid stabilization system protein ParE
MIFGTLSDLYEAERAGLGGEFRDEIQSTLERITRLPEAWRILSENTRRCRTNRFPYGVIYRYREETEAILVIAVAHLHRKPNFWKGRI